MEEGEGTRISSSSDKPGLTPSADTEDADSSKAPFSGNSAFIGNTTSQGLKMLLNYNSVNGDSVEKDLNQSEQSNVASSSNNSVYSGMSDESRDSILEEDNRSESDSSSDNSSKSSGSDVSEKRMQFSLRERFQPESSTDSEDLSDSDSDDERRDRRRVDTPEDESNDVKRETSRVETPDIHSSQSSLRETKDSPMEVDEQEKLDFSESNSSFKKEENTAPVESKKSESFDISDDSTVDSMNTSGPSLSSSVSQDISTPQTSSQPVSSQPVENVDTPPVIESTASDTLTANPALPPQPTDTSNTSSGDHNVTGEQSSNLGDSINGVLRESSETSSLSDAIPASTLAKPEDSDTKEKEKESTPSMSTMDEENSTQSNELDSRDSSNFSQKEPKRVAFKSPVHEENPLPETKYSLEAVPEDSKNLPDSTDEVDKNPDSAETKHTPECQAAKNAESSTGFNININEMSLVKPCTVSCFPKIEDESKINNDLSDNRNEGNNDAVRLAKSYPIRYKGFKKIGCFTNPQKLKKSFLRWNPFNPARKKDPKTGKYILHPNVLGQDPSSLQPEYAQYLGLQPIVKFKCSYCGISNFQSMSALNTHKIECKRNYVNPLPIALNKNKAITIRRKVYMCSVCGSYKPRGEVFQHMLEIHRLYICLFDKCLKICKSAESLMIHFLEDHKVTPLHSKTNDEFMKEIPPNSYLICVQCRRVFTELDDPCNHDCSTLAKCVNEQAPANEPDRVYCTLNRTPAPQPSEPASSQNWEITKVNSNSPLTLKLSKDITMKPVNDALASDSCQLKNSMNVQQVSHENSTESTSYKIVADVLPPEMVSKPMVDNFNIKVPNDIEIKPLMPGEDHNSDNKFEAANASGIEIFPIIQQQPIKPAKKVRTIIRKTIRKKKVIVKKKKISDAGILQNDASGTTGENVRPISPPVIAPPPIVRSPEAVSKPTPMETDNLGATNSAIANREEPREEPSFLQFPQKDENAQPRLESSQFANPPLSLPFPEHHEIPEKKRSLTKDIFKIKLQGDMDSDAESDDSQKLSLVVDENTSEDFKKDEAPPEGEESSLPPDNQKTDSNEIALASEDIAAMALTLDDKIENVPIQAVVKECVRTSCMSCNYCRHAVKIAVNGKQLALHLLSEHRYTPVKNETNDDVIRKLKSSLETLQTMHFNAETYDSSDPSIHVPYDKESNFDCFQCSYVSSTHKDLYAHKRKFHTKSLLLCIMCKKNFFSYSELICHICTGTYCANPQVYSVDINFRCCFCRLDTIPSAFRLMVHLRKSHHTCDICLEVCSDQQKLSTHMWKHKLNHLCYRCGIAYASKPDITKHLFWKHGTESVLCKKCLQKKWPHVYHFCIPPTSFICEECNTSFSKAVALKVHKRIHGNDYPYSCPQCEKKFVSKKLLARHIDRHNAVLEKIASGNKSPDDNKDEIINVTDVDNKEGSNDNSDNNKEGDGKDKSHKKHKKEKEKKDKKVVDVLDLPPPNLSSESDSSDEEGPKKTAPTEGTTTGEAADLQKVAAFLSDKTNAPDMPKLDGSDKSLESNVFLNLLKQEESSDEYAKRKPTASEPVSPFDSSVVNSLIPMGKDEKNDTMDSMQNDHIEGIWENFYKTNPQNSNLPFPLCAMKSEVAYSIVMGDHDYCQSAQVEPVIKEDLPSTSNLDAHLSDDKIEEVTPLIPEHPHTPPPVPTKVDTVTTPSKKKVKSPKKKVTKNSEDRNSSSSSDSSSDSDSSCSCATNCSCSSSSDSSSSSSSDSDSSTNEDKKDKRKKKKEKKAAGKTEKESDETKETTKREEEEAAKVLQPEDPPIRESELETDESTSDEEFYDRQPQIIANQLLAEKREKQIGLGTPVNNGDASPLPGTLTLQQATPTPPPTPVEQLFPPLPPAPQAQENIPPPELSTSISLNTPKPRQPRTKRKRRLGLTRTPKVEKPLPEIPYPKYNEPKQSPFSVFQQSPAANLKFTPAAVLGRSPSLTEAGGSGSETDNTRLSKRRRVPNKFYGYSSGEEEEKPTPSKWRKSESYPPVHHTPKLPPTIPHPPPTPRIQLTVPKQVIRRPYTKQSSRQKIQHHPVDSDSTDSGSDSDIRISHHQAPPELAKAEKDVYCYCRCPYDEVSEMIACDDANCKIEWFHFECVGILVPPRGQWYCPDCRKARGLP